VSKRFLNIACSKGKKGTSGNFFGAFVVCNRATLRSFFVKENCFHEKMSKSVVKTRIPYPPKFWNHCSVVHSLIVSPWPRQSYGKLVKWIWGWWCRRCYRMEDQIVTNKLSCFYHIRGIQHTRSAFT